MKYLISFIVIGSIFCSSELTAQIKVGDVTLPEKIQAGDTHLLFNGAGIRKKLWWDLYVGGLYLKSKNGNDKGIIHADAPMAIKMHITSTMITGERMEEAIREGFDKSTKGEIAPLTSRIDELITTFREEIKIGDIFDLVYIPGNGVKVYKNEKNAATIQGMDFKKALFGIWLSDDPVDKKLKENMLGL